MASLKANQLKREMFILYKGEPHEVLKCEFYFPGKGSAFARVKLKSVKTGNMYEYTYKSSETVETVEVETREMQFIYLDGNDAVFMDPRSFEQVTVPGHIFGRKVKFLIAELSMYLNFYEDEVIGVRFPPKVRLKVVESQQAVAGNTVNAAKKPAILETGAEVLVPLFVKEGDTLVIDTETGEYVSRA